MKLIRTVILAKAPIAGFAKTRLIPKLGAQGAAELAAWLIKYTVNQALNANIGPVELCVTPDRNHQLWRKLELADDITWSKQGVGDLGNRLARIAKRVIDKKEAVLLIGTDCPQLDKEKLRHAALVLQTADACLIPAEDGGYTLLGLQQFHPSLFVNIPWSTNKVAEITRQRIRLLKWNMRELPSLNDIDHPEDLKWLPADWSEIAAY